MRKEYDLQAMKGRKNPYAKRLKKQITMRLDTETIAYFKALACTTGLPYQSLIDIYLKDCAQNNKKLNFQWVASH
ncbi:MAG: BrnA antitoxin family protein [Planctomycetota bacterium]